MLTALGPPLPPVSPPTLQVIQMNKAGEYVEEEAPAEGGTAAAEGGGPGGAAGAVEMNEEERAMVAAAAAAGGAPAVSARGARGVVWERQGLEGQPFMRDNWAAEGWGPELLAGQLVGL